MNPTLARLLVPMFDLNPFHWAGDQVKKELADAFTSMMMSLWSAGLWLIDMVFGVIDRFTSPNLADPGLGRLYGVTLWLSFLTALVIGLAQIGLAALRRDGRSLGSVAVGVAQYCAVVASWVMVCAALVVGTAGLARGLLHTLLNVGGFAGYSASAGLTDNVTGTVQAAVLGMCSLFMLIPASFGYLLIMLVREAALMILTATMPIAAAGALGEGTKAWMWKSIRWFVAACLTAPLLALVVGVGAQISRAAFPGVVPQPHPDVAGQQLADSSANVGMAVVGCVIFLVSCFCPMALFRLLAFVDPGSASGASLRTTLAANGGVSGLLSGRRAAQDQGSGAATQVTSDGRAASETSADAETSNRFTSKFVKAFGAAGKVAGGAMDAVGTVATHGASMSVDVMGQAGVGHQGYYDTTPRQRSAGHAKTRTRVGHGWDPDQGQANDPPHSGGAEAGEAADAGDAGELAEDGAFLA
ncbi:MAG: hypothetical protein ACRDOD_12800 [Streptosporangiaceae bacterium]